MMAETVHLVLRFYILLVGRVLGLLSQLDETKNRVVYVHDIIVTQRQLMGIAQKIAPAKRWNPVTVNITNLVVRPRKSYAKGCLI